MECWNSSDVTHFRRAFGHCARPNDQTMSLITPRFTFDHPHLQTTSRPITTTTTTNLTQSHTNKHLQTTLPPCPNKSNKSSLPELSLLLLTGTRIRILWVSPAPPVLSPSSRLLSGKYLGWLADDQVFVSCVRVDKKQTGVSADAAKVSLGGGFLIQPLPVVPFDFVGRSWIGWWSSSSSA